MAVDGDQIIECQRVAAGCYLLPRFLVPIWLELAVSLGEAVSQRRIEDDRQLWPVGQVQLRAGIRGRA